MRYEEIYNGEEERGDRWMPSVVEESYNGKNTVDLRTRHLTSRRIFLYGEVNDKMAMDFTSQMLYLRDSDEPIDIYIDSPGGSVSAGLVIYDILQSLDGQIPITMYCVGLAASMGAVLLAGGQKGRRFILPHSKVMIHEPLISRGLGGSVTTVRKTSESMMETKEILNGILAKHSGKTMEEINEATAFDNYMNAKEAIAFGLVDEVKNLF